MGSNDHIDLELMGAINDLIDEGLLVEGSPAFGIAQQVIHLGYDSLSSKQAFVYDKEVIPVLIKRAEHIRVNEIFNSNPL